MRIAGHAAIFDVGDASGDVVRRGAFAGARAPLPLLYEHDPWRRIGTVVALRETERGLWIEAEVAGRHAGLLRSVDGLSFGYRVETAGPPFAPPAKAAWDWLESPNTVRAEPVEARSLPGPQEKGPSTACLRQSLRRAFDRLSPNGGWIEQAEDRSTAGNARTNRELSCVALIELSLVARPMQALARVERVDVGSEETVMIDMTGMMRPALSGAVERKNGAFVEGYLRSGLAHEVKSVVGTSGIDGGYTVPREIDQAIERLMRAGSPIRAIANVVAVGTAGYRKLVTAGGTPAGWVAEAAARPETETPDFHEIAPPMGELYANPAASQAMLDDAAFDLEGWLAEEIATEFARAEGEAFVTGSGTNRPKGFLTYSTSAEGDAVRAFGTLQHVASGAAAGFPASSPQDKLIDLVQALKAPYRQVAAFVMNASTLAVIRKFKTADGAFLWQPGLVTGQPDTLLGYPVVEAEAMPDIAANSLSVAFGNFRAGYVIADRGETQILRDPYSHKPFVHFYATKRVGGAVANSEAIKLMKFATS